MSMYVYKYMYILYVLCVCVWVGLCVCVGVWTVGMVVGSVDPVLTALYTKTCTDTHRCGDTAVTRHSTDSSGTAFGSK